MMTMIMLLLLLLMMMIGYKGIFYNFYRDILHLYNIVIAT